MSTTVHIRQVDGGFILDSQVDVGDDYISNTEIFTTLPKVLKATKEFFQIGETANVPDPKDPPF